MSCNHKEYIEPSWINTGFCDWTGEFIGGEWADDGGWEHTYVDTGLHTYKCTQCNETFYYSERVKKELTKRGKTNG
jgi:hypothetical protein